MENIVFHTKAEKIHICLTSNSKYTTVDYGDGIVQSIDTQHAVIFHDYKDTKEEHVVTIIGGIESLEIEYNNINILNLYDCLSLKHLRCSSNDLTFLDVSECSNLETLYCAYNKLDALLLSNKDNECNKLRLLECSENNLTALYLRGCESLEDINCYNNKLQYLITEYCPLLRILCCNDNPIKELNFTNNHMIQYIWCTDNNIDKKHMNELFASLPKGWYSSISWTGVDDDSSLKGKGWQSCH